MLLFVTSLLTAAPLDLCAGKTPCSITLTAEKDLEAAAHDAAEELGLTVTVADKAPTPVPSPKPTDAQFVFHVTRRDGKVVVDLNSLDRPASLYGEARELPMKTNKPAWASRVLKAAVRNAMEKAAADFRTRAKEVDLGRRKLSFSTRVGGLTQADRDDVAHSLVCLKSQLNLAGKVTEPEEHAGYLDETFEYIPGPDDPRDNLPYMSQKVREWLLGGPKSPCSLYNNPLSKLSPKVDIDQVNQMVVVGFTP